jgi:hypothetical protein
VAADRVGTDAGAAALGCRGVCGGDHAVESRRSSQVSRPIDDKGATVWASYRIEGRVEGKPVVQSDKRMFASEQEARTWLMGEAEQRGFNDFEPEVHAGA